MSKNEREDLCIKEVHQLDDNFKDEKYYSCSELMSSSSSAAQVIAETIIEYILERISCNNVDAFVDEICDEIELSGLKVWNILFNSSKYVGDTMKDKVKRYLWWNTTTLKEAIGGLEPIRCIARSIEA